MRSFIKTIGLCLLVLSLCIGLFACAENGSDEPATESRAVSTSTPESDGEPTPPATGTSSGKPDDSDEPDKPADTLEAGQHPGNDIANDDKWSPFY